MPLTDMKINLGGNVVPLPEGFEDYIDINRAAVVELDMHGGHLDPEPDCPSPSVRGRTIIQDVNRFNDACRELGVPIVHIVNTYRKGDFEGVESCWRRVTEGHFSMLPDDMHGPTKQFANLGLEDTKWSTLVVENKPGDIVVNTKKRVTAFETTDLDIVMRSLGKDVMIITGIMTNCCDLCSAYYANSKDYKIIFVFDMTRGSNPSDEDAAGRMVSEYLGLRTESEELLKEWRSQREVEKANA